MRSVWRSSGGPSRAYRSGSASAALKELIRAQGPVALDRLLFGTGVGTVEQLGNIWRRQLAPLQIGLGMVKPKVDQRDAKGQRVMVARYGLHSFRHHCISMWLAGGMAPATAQTYAGHSASRSRSTRTGISCRQGMRTSGWRRSRRTPNSTAARVCGHDAGMPATNGAGLRVALSHFLAESVESRRGQSSGRGANSGLKIRVSVVRFRPWAPASFQSRHSGQCVLGALSG